MSKNAKNKWTCIECKDKWTTKKESYQTYKEKGILESLADSV